MHDIPSLQLIKSASSRLGVFYHLKHFFPPSPPSQLLAIYRGIFHHCMEYACHWTHPSTQAHPYTVKPLDMNVSRYKFFWIKWTRNILNTYKIFSQDMYNHSSTYEDPTYSVLTLWCKSGSVLIYISRVVRRSICVVWMQNMYILYRQLRVTPCLSGNPNRGAWF